PAFGGWRGDGRPEGTPLPGAEELLHVVFRQDLALVDDEGLAAEGQEPLLGELADEPRGGRPRRPDQGRHVALAGSLGEDQVGALAAGPGRPPPWPAPGHPPP